MAGRAKGALWYTVFLAGALPFLGLVGVASFGSLGADPAKTLTHQTGTWAMNFLLLCLAMSPFSTYLKMPKLVSYRRQLGLWCYFYVCLHFLVFLALLIEFNPANMAKELVERPYITVGFGGFLLLTIMAITSIPRLIRAMGARRWRRLHKVVFAVVVLACIHFIWLSRSSLLEATVYSLLFGVLIGMRLYYYRERLQRQAATA
ncbi:MAG: sulfoxide reductase heme-binding subunit YedZ [Alphaproteobacteria bacterium GM202ARS2]|nr:sulfoxide reductase heme-binding subunit YedZ [Alphaproteobacteria bacterium GM202ARS2]